MRIEANIVDIPNGRIDFGICHIADGRIAALEVTGEERSDRPYLIPGFIDAHVHIESAMLVPTEFARMAVRHGTVATVSDPHEIANVLGAEGVEYMLENARSTPFKMFFGVPSCVPATSFETAGDSIDPAGVWQLLQHDDLRYLAEMMNYPGVLHGDPEVLAKIASAKALNKPVDGHAPGLTGEDAVRYIRAGISTDHECLTYAEAAHKLKHGMRILIREGSAAKNFEALHPLISEAPDSVMFCSDDKHPDDLIAGHINRLAARAVAKGHSWQHVLQCACINPVLHYGLPVGILRLHDPADMTLVRDLKAFEVLETYLNGERVFQEGKTFLAYQRPPVRNRFHANPISPEALRIPGKPGPQIRVIRAIDGSLFTEEMHVTPVLQDGMYVTDPGRDILKIAVVNRYSDAPVARAFTHGFGMQKGAIASSVAHDSHNIVAVGVDDRSISEAVNAVIHEKGGIAAVADGNVRILALPVAGIMSENEGEEVAAAYTSLDQYAKQALGCVLHAPFMTLSFMALLVIPQLKLSDKGLFDGRSFRFVDLEVK